VGINNILLQYPMHSRQRNYAIKAGMGHFINYIRNESIPKNNKIIFDQQRKYFDEKQISFC
jgi:hypothetical protein